MSWTTSAEVEFYFENASLDEDQTQLILPLRVKGFEGIGGFQFTLGWDPELLRLKAVTDFNHMQDPTELYFFGVQNFNLDMATEGLCPVLYEQILSQDVSLPDESHILSLVFDVIVPFTAPARVEFVAEPTPGKVASFFGTAPKFRGQGAVVEGPANNASPIIALLGPSQVLHQAGTPFDDPGASVQFGDGSSMIIPATQILDPGKLGEVTLSYAFFDAGAALTVQVDRQVKVVDTLPPQVKLTGESHIRHPLGRSYEDSGSVALDLFEGSLQVDVEGEVTVDKPGNYFLTFVAKDSSGNQSEPIIRTITVVKPQISSIDHYSLILPQVSLTFTTQEQNNYLIEQTRSLEDAMWHTVASRQGNGSQMTVEISTQQSDGSGFFRVLSW